MPRYMLDTDIASYVMKGSSAPVLAKLRKLDVTDVCISVVTRCELAFGVELSPQRARDEARLLVLLKHIEVLDFPERAASDYGRIRADLHRRGAMIGGNDLLIAAHALCLGLTLVTNNTREFGRVKGLKFENWT
ncbi:MAG TPA: PIN domain-containing protein [Terracidiphilus sp.]|nr:PIN domain-containing protein [Terracidiphilus sp.]